MANEAKQSKDAPPFLTVGTEVSAKFKGAFCEAKVKKISKSVKVKVMLKESPYGTITVDDTAVRGQLRLNEVVEVMHGKHLQKGTIQLIKDCSTYTVVFDDGDERALRRTQLCLKGDKHFDEAVSLDNMPLYHPDAFANPSQSGRRAITTRKLKRTTRRNSDGSGPDESDDESGPSSSQRRSLRSASVTPLKGIQSTRSATRAVAALRLGKKGREQRESSLLAQRRIAATPTSVTDEEADEEMDEDEEEQDEQPQPQKKPAGTRDQALDESDASESDSNPPEKKPKVEDESSDEPGPSSSKDKDKKNTAKRQSKPSADMREQSSAGTDKEFKTGTVVLVTEKIPARTQLGVVVAQAAYSKAPFSKSVVPDGLVPLRSLQNGRYFLARLQHVSSFDLDECRRLFAEGSNSDSGRKLAFDRAQLLANKGELPSGWEHKSIYGEGKPGRPPKKRVPSPSSGESSESQEEDEEYNDRRDRFVAHFYKFQDDSGNPMNRIPILGGKEIDLYRLYDVVTRLGGHKKVTQEAKWKKVLVKMHLEDCSGATPQTVKIAYLRYFEKFEAFMKRLGYSSLNESATVSSTTRTSRAIRPGLVPDAKRKADAAKDKRSSTKERESAEKKVKGSAKEGSARGSKATSPADTIPGSPASAASSSVSKKDAEKEPARPPSVPASTHSQQSSEVKEEDKTKKVATAKKHDDKKKKDEDDKKKKDEKSSTAKEKSPKPAKKEKSEKKSDVKERHPSQGSQASDRPATKRERKESESLIASSDEDVARKRRDYRRNSKDDRASPAGVANQAAREEGYTNAHIFIQFYQGQNVLAKHNLHFYNARVVTVRQPTIKEIVSSLKNAYELGKITHPSSPTLSKLSYENLSAEMKDALKNMMTSTQIYVHYLGWNSRYDEWLALHKIRVDEIDSKQSLKAAQELIPPEFPQQLFAAAIDYCKSFESLSSSTSQRGQGQGPSGERARPSTSSNSSSNSGDKDKDAKSSNHSKITVSSAKPTSATHTANVHTPDRPSQLSKFTIPLRSSQQKQQPDTPKSPLAPQSSESSTPKQTERPSSAKGASTPIGIKQQQAVATSSSQIASATETTSSSTSVKVSSLALAVELASEAPITVATSSANASTTVSAKLPLRRDLSERRPPSRMALAAHQFAMEKKKQKEPEPLVLPEETTAADLQLTAAGRYGEAHKTLHIINTEECTFACKAPNPAPPLPVVVTREEKPAEATTDVRKDEVPSSSTTTQTSTDELPTASVKLVEPLAIATESSRPEADESAPPGISKDTRDLLSPRQGGHPSSSDDRSSRHDDDDESSTYDDDDVHVEITTKLRHRVQNEMDAQGLFDSYGYVDLAELELDGDDPERSSVLIEERMQDLKVIYHKYRKKMARLDRLYKATMRNKRRREKELRGKEGGSERSGEHATTDEAAAESSAESSAALTESESASTSAL